MINIVGLVSSVVSPSLNKPSFEDKNDGTHQQEGTNERNHGHHDVIKNINLDNYPLRNSNRDLCIFFSHKAHYKLIFFTISLLAE